jgi:hypothetical protein
LLALRHDQTSQFPQATGRRRRRGTSSPHGRGGRGAEADCQEGAESNHCRLHRARKKAFAHPTDSKLLETARVKLFEAAKAKGLELKQTYAKEGQLVGYKAGRYDLPR